MDKLIITVTVDSSMSYPRNPYCPPPSEIERVAEEYVRSVEAGASIVHMHGVHKLEDEIRSEEHTSELQSQSNLVCRLLLEKKKHDLARLGSTGSVFCSPLL